MSAEWNLRPARDHGLTPRERLQSGGRESGVGGVAVGAAWRVLMRGYLGAAHRMRVVHRERWPEPPFVVVANHSSHLDALAIATALPIALRRRAYAMAAGDTFFTSLPAAAFAAYAINALPVWRHHTTEDDIALWRERLLGDRAVLILFPEGTRTRTGAMGRFRPGVGALVAGRPVPVVPCYLDGAFAAWPPIRRMPRPGRLRLTVGVPLVFDGLAPDRAGALEVARACEEAVRALAPATA